MVSYISLLVQKESRPELHQLGLLLYMIVLLKIIVIIIIIIILSGV